MTLLVKKEVIPIHVEAVDGRDLASWDVTHKIEQLEVSFKGHKSKIIFKIIKILSNPMVLGFSWLEKYNLVVDWKLRNQLFYLETLAIGTLS